MGDASTMDYAFPLRPDLTVAIRGMPRDLKMSEIERLKGFLFSLVIPEQADCIHPWIVVDRCRDCGAYVGPQP